MPQRIAHKNVENSAADDARQGAPGRSGGFTPCPGEILHPTSSQQDDGEVSQRSQHVRRVALAYRGEILVESLVADPVTLVLDSPVPADQRCKTYGIRTLRRATGDAMDDISAHLARLDLRALPTHRPDLGDMREIDEVVDLGAGPDLTNLDATVGLLLRPVLRGEMRSIPKPQCLRGGSSDCL
jgi:hypothetical protein